MDIFKKYFGVFLVVVVVLILVLFRLTGSDRFRPDAEKWAEPSFNGANIASPGDISSLQGEKLLVNLGEYAEIAGTVSFPSISLDAHSILIKENLDHIRKNCGPVFLAASDPAITARIWMILNQMGIRNIYILSEHNDNEISRNKFRPDSLVRPEL